MPAKRIAFGCNIFFGLLFFLSQVLSLGNTYTIDGMFTVMSNITQPPPFQHQNTKAKEITKIIMENKCKLLEKSWRFALVDHKVYSFRRRAGSQENSEIEDFLMKHSETLPNMYLLVLPKQSLDASDLDILRGQLCRPIPFFLDQGANLETVQMQHAHSLLRTYANTQNLALTRKEKIKIQEGEDIHDIILSKLQLQYFTLLNDQDFELWFKNLDLITIEEVIEEFPFIRRNMDPIILSEMFSKTSCNNVLINYLIMDNEVYVGQRVYDRKRTYAVKHFIEQIIKDVKLPDMYIIVHTNDFLDQTHIPPQQHKLCRQMPLFMMNKNSSDYLEQTKFLMPDTYVIQADWMDSIQLLKKSNLQFLWQSKLKTALFRGLASGPHFYDIGINNNVDFFRYFHRAAFVMLSFQFPNLIDARFTNNYYANASLLIDETRRRIGSDKNIVFFRINQNQYPKYRYLLTADGFGAPWRRTPYILFSNSLLLKPYSQKIQWFYDKMVPNVHYIPIKQDLSDLISRIQQMNKEDSKVKDIPKKANKLAEEFLTSQAFKSYMAEVLLKYAKIQQLKLSQKAKQMIKNHRKINRVFRKLRRAALQTNYERDQGLEIIVEKQLCFLFFNFFLLCLFPIISAFKNKRQIKKNKSIQINQEQYD